MKIAKKVLAVVMAVAMIAALSAMAFAAEPTPAVKAVKNDDGTITVTVSAKNAEGLKTYDPVLVYPADVLEVKGSVKGAALADGYTTIGKNVTAEYNKAYSTNMVKFGVVLSEQVLSNDEYNKLVEDEDVEASKRVALDTAEIDIATVKFAVKAGQDPAEVTFQLCADESTDTEKKVGTVYGTATVTLKEKEPEAKPADVKPAVEETTTNPSTGDKKTGDNMALAAAAGVVVLAGAAFIISKKRK